MISAKQRGEEPDVEKEKVWHIVVMLMIGRAGNVDNADKHDRGWMFFRFQRKKKNCNLEYIFHKSTERKEKVYKF